MSSLFSQTLLENYHLIIASVVVSLFLAWGLNSPLGIVSSDQEKKKDYFKTTIISLVISFGFLYYMTNSIEMDQVLPGQAPF